MSPGRALLEPRARRLESRGECRPGDRLRHWSRSRTRGWSRSCLRARPRGSASHPPRTACEPRAPRLRPRQAVDSPTLISSCGPPTAVASIAAPPRPTIGPWSYRDATFIVTRTGCVCFCSTRVKRGGRLPRVHGQAMLRATHQEARDDRHVGEGAREAGPQGSVPQGHRGGRARLRARRARLLPLQRPSRCAGREHLLLLRGLRGPGGAGEAPHHAALQDLAGSGRRARRADGAHALYDDVPRRQEVLDDEALASGERRVARFLDGIRVIDAASFIAGPVATTVMADFGAEVIKIEPPSGDTYRTRGPGYPPSPYNFPWIVDNRSKRGLALDLRTPDGQRVLHRLVRDADVFVTNTPIETRTRLGVRWEDLAPLNPRLIYGSITAYGERGEEASRPGFDATALWARTGLMDLVRPSPDAAPARSLPGMGDHPTGMSLFGALMAALYQRERTGRGTMVSTSLVANGLWLNAIQVQGILCGARTVVRPPREEAVDATGNLYRCRDGRWFLLALTADGRRWPAFARAIGREDLLTDPRFAEAAGRRANVRALIAILDAVFAERDWAEWRRVLESAGIAFGVVGTLDDIPHDTQMRDSGALVPFDDPRAGASLTVSSPVWMDGQEKVPPTLAPEIGEHSVEILRKAGFDQVEIDRLLASGVVIQAKP